LTAMHEESMPSSCLIKRWRREYIRNSVYIYGA